MKTLVAYFSATGSTAGLAKKIAEAADADLFEIRPVDPYTEADIKWTNPVSRCNKEKLGKKNVPIDGRVSDWDEYQFVFIGFPIWYFAAPNIIETFVKSYDFTEKNVALFATSGGSDIIKVPGKLQPLMDGAIIGSKLFDPDTDMETLKGWVENLMEEDI